MCGRYVIVTKVKEVEKRFNVQAGSEAAYFSPRYNLGPGSSGLVITDKDPQQLQLFTFGYTPFWSKKRLYIFNARAEGDRNKENDPDYKGAREIFLKPMFRHSIRTKRCLIPADAFIEGPEREKLSKPYVVYLREKQRPFAFAGVWDEWVNKETGEVHHGYAIITTTSNSVTQAIQHHRSPVILPREWESSWLSKELSLKETLNLLSPYPGELMNAYPISDAIRSPRHEGPELLKPIGEPLFKESEWSITEELRLDGMGSTTGRRKRNEGEGSSSV